jgi:hypothetical protein
LLGSPLSWGWKKVHQKLDNMVSMYYFCIVSGANPAYKIVTEELRAMLKNLPLYPLMEG